MDKKILDSHIPDELLVKIEEIEHSLRIGRITPNEKFAVFDLDNTLLFGDVGEAVFSQFDSALQENGLQNIEIQFFHTVLEMPYYHAVYSR